MQLNVTTIGMLIGGLGLFLLAVGMITDGLKLAAGGALRSMLTRSTRTPGRGILTGITITALVQSSSAVTVATIGFVNAGLLSLYQSLGIVYGANIGTTMTGWLVAIIGFNIKVEAFALPMVGIGMMLRLIKGGTRWGSLGTALAGFGLFFIGIDVLKNAFEGIAAGIELENRDVPGITGVLMYLGIGFAMTLFTQSSSAAIAITLTAASGGVVSLESAAAMVIGANVGTTSTAGFAVIGATPNAKRVASAHVIFNLLTGFVALLILPLLFLVIGYTGKLLGLADNPAITLALFHSLFNLLGVLLMWPLSSKMSNYLLQRFRSAEEIESKPRYLDNTVLVTPSLALNALCLELVHVLGMTRELATDALHTRDTANQNIETRFAAVENLGKTIHAFIVQMSSRNLSEVVSQQLPKAVYALQCYRTIADLGFHYARHQPNLAYIDDENIVKPLNDFKLRALELIAASENMESVTLDEQQAEFHKAYRDLRAELLVTATHKRTSIETIEQAIDQIYRIDRIAKQLARGIRLLVELESVAQLSKETTEEVEELTETTY